MSAILERRILVVMVVFALAAFAAPRAQESPAGAKQPPFEQILDLYVRDGFVYYRALKSDRAKLDGYLNQLAAADAARLSRNEQVAFWLNAYNAIVLRTVLNHYPIQGHASAYPSRSRPVTAPCS